MDIDLIFKIAAIGIIVAVINQLLSHYKRDDMAMMVTLAGVIGVFLMMIRQLNYLFDFIKQSFGL